LLVRLPGFSWKTARCVLLYSLDRDVFPIDSNTFRVLKRAGILPASAVYRRRSLHDALQAAIPAPSRRAFHVNLVVHGQRTCLPRAPHCAECVARASCPMRGVPLSARAKPALHSAFARAS
jgi:endonuclease III